MELVSVYPNNPLAVHNLTASNTAANVGAASSSRVFVSADVYNPHATDVAYLQVFGVPAASVTLGTTVPIATFACTPGKTLAADGYTRRCPDGMSYAITATRTGAGAPTSAVSLSLYYV